MNTIFIRSEFTLCKVPVPKGYPQSQTHAGIAMYKGAYLLTTSPFPSISLGKWVARIRRVLYLISCKLIFKPIRGEYFENPLIYKSVQDNNSPAINFQLMQDRPLMESPDPYFGYPAFNSDPDIFIDGDVVNVLNRVIYRTKVCSGESLNKYYTRLFLVQGIVDGHKFKFYKNELLKENDIMYASPCMLKYKDRYILTYLDTISYIDGKTFNGLYFVEGASVDDVKNNENWKKIDVDSPGFLPWHMSIFEYEGKLYSIVACVKENEPQRCWQMFGEISSNMREMYIYRTPLTDFNSYRGSACVTEDGEFVLYSTTVHEKIKYGNSIDGREVIMAHMPFEVLLKKIKENE